MSLIASENMSSPDAGRVRLFWANSSVMGPGTRLLLHSHSYWQLYYLASGHAAFVSGDVRYDVSSGYAFLIPAFLPHELLPIEEEDTALYELKLNIPDPFIADKLKDNPRILSMKDSETYFKYICASWTDHDRQNLMDTECILTSLLLKFFIDDLHYAKSDSSYFITDGYSELTRQIMVYIERNYPYPIRLSSIGAACSYNPNYLCTVFSKDTGITIIDYINLVRIRKAAVIFFYYGQDVAATAESVGFTNLSHFSRTFKKYVGIPPADFRRAFTSVNRAKLNEHFSSEPLLSYRMCRMDEALTSLRSWGAMIRECGE